MTNTYQSRVEAVVYGMLDGLEQRPRMYGTCLEAVEAQYWTLLHVLGAGYELDPDVIRDTFHRITVAKVGGGCDSFLWSRCKTMDELVSGLREIRTAVEALRPMK